MASARNPVSVLLKLMKRNYKKLTDARETFEVISNRMGVLDNPQELVAFLGQHLKPKELEKKQNGEVFTPPDLIQQKFNKLTLADPHIWSDPWKRFLDPANGIGNYPALAFHRLMEGLKNAIPNEALRKKHILENMLYMCELNKKNIEVSRKVFDPEGMYSLNLYQGSYLDLDPKKEWGVEKFDVIFGNPPYQEKVGPRKTNTLWDKFVKKSLDLLIMGGFLVFVHPSGWRNIDGKFKNIQDLIFDNNLCYLEIHNEKDGIEVFKSETRYDWYILQHTIVSETKTIVKFQDGYQSTINVKGLGFIPNAQFDRIYSLIAKIGEEKCNVLHDYSSYETRKKWMSRTKSSDKIHPCVYTVNHIDEIKSFYSSEKKKHFGVSKLIWSNGRISSLGSYSDADGLYGLTQFAYAIVDSPDNLIPIKKVFDSRDFRKLMEHCSVGQNTINYKAIALFKKDFWKTFELHPSNIIINAVESIPPTVEPVAQAIAVSTTTQPDYKKMKVADLKQLCLTREIDTIKKKKEELVSALITWDESKNTIVVPKKRVFKVVSTPAI